MDYPQSTASYDLWATLWIWYGVFAEVNEAMNEMLDPVATFDNPKIALTSVDESVQAAISGLISSAQSKPETLDNAVGNVSLGQYIMAGSMSALGGSSATGMSKTINPIITYKNIGDNALALAQTLYFAHTVLKEIPLLQTVAEKVSSMASKSSGIMKIVSDKLGLTPSTLIPQSILQNWI